MKLQEFTFDRTSKQTMVRKMGSLRTALLAECRPSSSRLHGPAPEMSLAELIHLNPTPRDPEVKRKEPVSGCGVMRRAGVSMLESWLFAKFGSLGISTTGNSGVSSGGLGKEFGEELSFEDQRRISCAFEVRGRQLGGSRTAPSRQCL